MVRTYRRLINSFIYANDRDFDRRLNKAEFVEAVNETLFDLVLEDVFKSADPSKYYEDNFINESTEEEAMTLLFPKNDTVLGQNDFLQMIHHLDTNRDRKVQREEIRDMFQTHRAKIALPFKKAIKQVLNHLSLHTYRPSTITNDYYEYYYGSRDQLKNFTEA